MSALKPTSLDIEPGDYLVVTGTSGSGKSTLLNLIGLLDTPTGGRYLIHGVDVARVSEGERCAIRGRMFGFVFQAFHLLPARSALENVEMGMLYNGRSRLERRRVAMDALARVGLADRIDADPRSLSGGERQRVAIARAVAGSPRVLLCDEPTGNLDSVNTRAVLDLIDELHRDGLTVVLVTHDEDVARRGKRRVVVHDGQVVEVSRVARASWTSWVWRPHASGRATWSGNARRPCYGIGADHYLRRLARCLGRRRSS